MIYFNNITHYKLFISSVIIIINFIFLNNIETLRRSSHLHIHWFVEIYFCYCRDCQWEHEFNSL